MKLRNKKTGQIVDSLQPLIGGKGSTLEELCEVWEDYEEPEGCWFITEYGGVEEARDGSKVEDDEDYTGIGNCFKTRAEAEKAVEKLKAWKRLKDKGLKFDGWTRVSDGEDERITIKLKSDNPVYGITGELGLLFGGGND